MTQTLGSSSLGGGDAIFPPKNKKPYTTEHLAQLASLSREQKVEFNRLISVRNTSRVEKESRRESDNSISPASSVESLIDIPDEEDAPSRPSTPKNGNKFQAAMHMLVSLSPTVFDSIVGFISSKRKAPDDADLDEVSELKKLKLFTTEGETKITPGATLAEEGDTMPRRKLASKISIIDISQFKDESLLTKDEFREAIDGAMMVFAALGDASYIRRWDDHWTWFLNLPDFGDNFDAVLACDIELRHEYRTSPFKFDPIHYNTRYHSKLADLQLARMKQLERNMCSSLGGRSAGPGPSSSRGAGPQATGRRAGRGGTGAGTGLAPVCLVCSR
ncbi:hypothetical protein OE88DRAFT_1734140 [Heliocybe sulcata]|uniref:Uncharacterized protein n=1 Tax=Heliocybe sulcata TaxID=5364 RepID=A0A5C3N9S6_9AGAM|nr:hypothetical protein OE88DRAFT_1734140 [Heliocybe sulcata]